MKAEFMALVAFRTAADLALGAIPLLSAIMLCKPGPKA